MENDPLYILLADDDESDRLLFKEAFAEIKIQTVVNTVNDGTELMEWLNLNNNRSPDLLFLDLNMPCKNGVECLLEIKSDKRLKDIFIAIYSTSNNEKDIEETFCNGANVYITKPSRFEMLKQVLERVVLVTYQYRDQSLKRENFLLKI
ncbi:MAG: response regulator [Cyclobacteriaceae bacterium]